MVGVSLSTLCPQGRQISYNIFVHVHGFSRNTMGFKYCMMRFIFQCCCYVLVLVVVFLQVYGGYHGTFFSEFVAITVCSCIFLWLELIQLFRSWKDYFTQVPLLVLSLVSPCFRFSFFLTAAFLLYNDGEYSVLFSFFLCRFV